MCARHLMWEHKKVLNSTPEHAHFLPAKGCARVWVCVCVRWITDICSLQLLVDIFAVSSAAAEAAEAAALAKGICISFKSLNKTSSCMSNNVSGTSATAGGLCSAGYTNWSCHSHVASVRARVAVPVAVSWAGQQLAGAGACAPNWLPKILRIRCVVRTWQSMPKAKAKAQSSVVHLDSLLFALRLCSTLVYPDTADTNTNTYMHEYLYMYCIWFILFGIYFLRSCESQKLYMQIRMPSICWECFSFGGVSKTVVSPFDCLSAKAY